MRLYGNTQASTPPSSWYLSPEVFELEKLAIFHRNWLVSLSPVSGTRQRHVHALEGMQVEQYSFCYPVSSACCWPHSSTLMSWTCADGGACQPGIQIRRLLHRHHC